MRPPKAVRAAGAGRALLLCLALAAPASCTREPAEHPGRAEGQPARVSTLRVGASSAGDGVLLPARIEAREEVTVVSRIAGQLTSLPVNEGGRIRRGEPVALFGAPETRAAVEAARAARAAAATRREQGRRQESRMDSLYEERVASLRELEIAQAERRASEAAYAAAEAAEAEWTAGAAVPAPFDGVLVRHRVDPGTTVGVGEPLLELRSGESPMVKVAVPEAYASALEKTPAWLQVGSGPWISLRLVSAEGMIDPATRTKTARYLPVARGTRLEPGAFSRVRLDTADGAGPRAEEAASLTIPSRSVVRRGALTGVFVISEARASLRWIRLGRERGAEVEVLAGLGAGEEIATDPAGLADGRAVAPSP